MRWLFVLAAIAAPAVASADDADLTSTAATEPQRALAADLGVTGGGGATPGGLRIGGRYLYRLAAHDWFEGGVAFTFGAPRAACGRVPPDGMACDHGAVDGFAGDLSLGVRRELTGQRGFVPFVHGGVFGRVLRFQPDDVTGAAAGLALGFGVRAAVRGDLSIAGGATAFAGLAHLTGGVGDAGQLGLTIGAAAEYSVR